LLGILSNVHEASIALAIVDEISERAAAEPYEQITAVYVRIGALSSVVPEALTFAWDIATDGTLASGSQLHIDHVPLAIFCAPCNSERTIDNGVLPICPVCGVSSTQIVRGRELSVTAMEVVYAPALGGHPAEHSSKEHYAGT
jgi:hydrogenase nickel incorporation protein HypA/HybF